MSIADRFPEAVAPLAWGATVNYDQKRWTPFDPDKWVLHWGGLPVLASAAAGDPEWEVVQLQRWESFHINGRGWLGIAYNYAIGNSGTLYRLRGDNRSGATSGDYEGDGIPENHEAVAVVFVVGVGQTVTPAALATFRDMYAAVPELSLVIGHRDVHANSGTGTDTQCPGDQLAEWIATKGYLPPEGDDDMFVRFGDLSPWVGRLQARLGVTVDNDYGPATRDALAAAIGTDGEFYGLEEAVALGELDALVELVGRRVWGETFQSAGTDKPSAETVVTRTYNKVING